MGESGPLFDYLISRQQRRLRDRQPQRLASPGRLSKLSPRFSSARSKGDRDIDDSVTILQDNIRVGSRPHFYLLNIGRTNAPLLKLSLERGPVLRTEPVCHTSIHFLTSPCGHESFPRSSTLTVTPIRAYVSAPPRARAASSDPRIWHGSSPAHPRRRSTVQIEASIPPPWARTSVAGPSAKSPGG